MYKGLHSTTYHRNSCHDNYKGLHPCKHHSTSGIGIGAPAVIGTRVYTLLHITTALIQVNTPLAVRCTSVYVPVHINTALV